MKKTYVLIGNYGSGKTEISLNLALESRKKGSTVLVDLDIINPYFRSTERKDMLDEHDIQLFSPIFAMTTVEVPSLPPDIYSVFIDNHDTVIFDVGGDPAGAIALGQYKHHFDTLEDLEVLYVVNAIRPFTKEVDMVLDMMEKIKACSRLNITGFVNNSNISYETTKEEIMRGYELMKGLYEKTGIETRMTTGIEEQLNEFMKDAEAMNLDKKFIGETMPIKRYMHRDWETFSEYGI